MKIPTYTERQEKMTQVRIKHDLMLDLLYANVGDEVFYECYSSGGNFISSGVGVVVDMVQHHKFKLSVKYKVRDNSTGVEHEVMHNVHSYPNDVIEVIKKREKTMFYSGYDTLTKQVVPNTMGKFKSDVDTELTRKLGIDWKRENSYIEIRLVEVKLLVEE